MSEVETVTETVYAYQRSVSCECGKRVPADEDHFIGAEGGKELEDGETLHRPIVAIFECDSCSEEILGYFKPKEVRDEDE